MCWMIQDEWSPKERFERSARCDIAALIEMDESDRKMFLEEAVSIGPVSRYG